MKKEVRNAVGKVWMTLTQLVLCCAFSYVQAQAPISVPYQFGFESTETAEMANWVLNPGTNSSRCVDAWAVGTATKSSGKQSLYISNDAGVDAQFGVGANVQYAYRDFTIARGVYDLSFDWRCLGSPNATLYAGVAPAGNVTSAMVANWQTAVVPNAISSWCATLGKMDGTTLWKNSSISLSSNGTTTYRLFFVWASSNRDSTLAVPLGACIDNIQICSANCAKPKSLTAKATCDTVFVSWDGTSEMYGLEYRKRGASRWTLVSNSLNQESAILEGLDEGLYDLRVRGICNQTDTSAYTYLNSFVLFCPERHCVNYVNLQDSTTVTCTYGTFANPQANTGVVDYGADDKYSRHTVNWEPDVYDPRTCNQLPTIPEGELASVRLGNWNNGAEAESMSFTYTADLQNAAILLLKYAVVLEDPDHGATSQPRFSLEILDESGQLISPTCGAEDFYASAQLMGQHGWHTCGSAPGANSPVRWKEWTTIGLNLSEVGVQDGEQLTIRLTTKDCSASAHFGYAYFTLGCAAAKLTGTSCGNESSLSVEAPDGFVYAWYDKYGNFVTDQKKLSVEPSDTTTYRCQLSYIGNSECDFNLYTSVRPRFPIPAFAYKYDPSDCQNKVRFTNKSHVMTVFENDTVFHYDEGLESYKWDFGTGAAQIEDKNPVYTFPKEGGVFPVTLYGSISDGACVEDTTIYITIPTIGDSETFIDTILCEGSYVVFGKYYAGAEGEYRDEYKSAAGCDSVMTLRVKISPVSDQYVGDTTICADEVLRIGNDIYRHHTSGEFVRFLKNQYGCDSTLRMNVTVLDSILPTVKMNDVVGDQENSGSFEIGGTGYTYYTINGEKNGALTGLNGGHFEIDFYNDHGCVTTVTEDMTYPCRTLIFQRWNDVLSVMNEMAQQQYAPSAKPLSFLSYQWIRNGEDIIGATKSYLYVADGLKTTDVYQVRVVTTDGEIIESCPFTPEAYTKVSPVSEAEKVIEDNILYIIVGDRRYNAQGERTK